MSLFPEFTRGIFWDTNYNDLKIGKHDLYIIERVLDYGQQSDWELLQKLYTKEEIIKYATQSRNLKPKTVSFLSVIYNIPQNQFRCYTERQSQKIHFDY
ncbi:MAG: hypothetical protein CMC96_02875 [Flavobacteriales bacterium]|nr:hypothetical protein [Flavobacteriales bacterium]